MALGLKYPSFDKVEELIQDNFILSSEHSEENYECMKNIFNKYNNNEIVRGMGVKINEGGGGFKHYNRTFIFCVRC